MKKTIFTVLLGLFLFGCSVGVFADAAVYDWDVKRECNYTAYVSTVDGGVNLREEPTVNAPILCTIPDFVALTITMETTEGWGFTEYNGTYGWVALSQLSSDYPITDVAMTVKVTASDGVNLREGPYTSYSKVLSSAIPSGKILKVTGISENNWGQVQYDGVSGWIALSQVKEVTKSNSPDNDTVDTEETEITEETLDDTEQVDEESASATETVTAEEPGSAFPVGILIVGVILIIVVIAAVLIVVLVSKKM